MPAKRGGGRGGCPPPPLLQKLVINNTGYYTQGYADVLAILILGKEFNMTMDLMQGALKIVKELVQCGGLESESMEDSSNTFYS
jgi:hypothetical protein